MTTDTPPSPTAGMTLPVETVNLLEAIQLFDEFCVMEPQNSGLAKSFFWELANGVRDRAIAFLMQKADERAQVAAVKAANLTDTFDDWMACFVEEELDELQGLLPEDKRDAAFELITNELRQRSDARIQAVIKQRPEDEQTATTEALAELLSSVLHTVTAICTIDDFKSFFSPNEQEDVDAWLSEATAAAAEWVEARDDRNQVKNALGIADREMA